VTPWALSSQKAAPAVGARQDGLFMVRPASTASAARRSANNALARLTTEKGYEGKHGRRGSREGGLLPHPPPRQPRPPPRQRPDVRLRTRPTRQPAARRYHEANKARAVGECTHPQRSANDRGGKGRVYSGAGRRGARDDRGRSPGGRAKPIPLAGGLRKSPLRGGRTEGRQEKTVYQRPGPRFAKSWY